MLVIGDVLVSDDLVEEKFVCDLNACKGACCTEGDYGAPVDQHEMETIKNIWMSLLKIFLNAPKSFLKLKNDSLTIMTRAYGAHHVMRMVPAFSY